MKKSKLRIMSTFLTVILTSSMFLNANINGVAASDLHYEKMKAALSEKVYKRSNLVDLLKKLPKDASKAIDKLKSNNNTSLSTLNPNEIVRIIIQLDKDPAVKKSTTDTSITKKSNNINEVKASQNSIIKKVEKLTGSKMKQAYGYLVNGFSINAKRSEIDKIKAIAGVKTVTLATTYNVDMNFAKELTQTYGTWSELGYKGEGMVISIIDTGIDYNHKDLILSDSSKAKLTSKNPQGPGKYFTDKVPYGYNFADANTTVIDSNPTTEMHGMHVAGIAAANGKQEDISSFKSVQGVAPEAQLLAMKVFSNDPSAKGAYSDVIISAIEDSVLHGADVINMSLGSDSGFTDSEDPEQIAVKNAVDQGVVVVTAAGNSSVSTGDPLDPISQKNLLGTVDTATVGDPSTASDAISVASYENTKITIPQMDYTSNVADKSGSLTFVNGSIDSDTILTDPSGYKLIDCGEGRNVADTPESTVSDFNATTLAGNIALVHCSDGMYGNKELAAQNAGAVAIIFYSDNANDSTAGFGNYMPCLTISKLNAIKLKNVINNDLKIYFRGTKTSNANPSANDMSYFSSWGPTPSLDFKPEISAPGGNIYSLANNNKYQSMSGTSMATPNTSGGEALVVQAIKSKNIGISGRTLVEFAKNTAINTAKIEIEKQNNSIPYSPRRQGSGLLQIKDAANNNVIVTDNKGNAAFSLKEIGKTTTFALNLKNYGNAAVTYTLPKGYILSESVDKSTSLIKEYSIPGANMNFDKNTVTVPAKGDTKVNVTITLPDTFNKQQYVEGFIKLISNDTKVPSLNVPYIAFYGNWSAVQNIDKPAWESDSVSTPALSNFMSSLVSESLGTKVQINAQAGTDLLTLNSNGILTCGLLPSDNINLEDIQAGKPINLATIDPDKIAFSPNGDNSNDLVVPNLYHLRNVKNIKVDVLDKNKNVLRTLNNNSNERKDLLPINLFRGLFSGLLGGSIIMGTPNINYGWDGTIYDASTGKYVTAPEGEYYIRITSKADMPDAKGQIVDMPVKIDVITPEVKITSENIGSDGNCLLKWTETDNVHGSGINPSINGILINGQPIDEKTAGPISYDEASKTYKCNVKLKQDTNNFIEIGAQDYAGNVGMDNIYVKNGSLNSVSFDNLSDNIKLNNKSFTIKGQVREDIKTLSINGSNATIENNLTFAQTIELKEGSNSITVKALDVNKKELFNNTYNVSCDDVAPVISITKPLLDSTGIAYTADNNLTISGNVNDAHTSQLTINEIGKDGIITPIDAKGNFTTNVVVQDNTYIQIEAIDDYGNIADNGISVIYTANTMPFSVNFDNLGTYMILPKVATNNDVYEITGHVNHPTKVFTINNSPVTVNKDLSFTFQVKLNQGKNAIKVYAEGDNKNVLIDTQYKIFYANKSPKLVMTNPSINADGNIYTNKNSLIISGQTVSEGFDYSLYINGSSVMKVVNSPVNSKKDFAYNVPVKNGDKLDIVLVDDAGNVYEDMPNVVVDKTAPKTPTITLDKTKPTNKNVLATVSADKSDKDIAKTEYSFDHNTWLQYSNPFSVPSNVKVYAKLTDFAGNSSEVSLDITNIDKIPPKTPSISLDNTKPTNKDVLVTINTDKLDKDIADIEYSFDNNSWVQYTKSFSVSGNTKVYSKAIDLVGNCSGISTIDITNIDKTPPLVTVTGVEDGKSYNSNIKPKITSNEGTLSLQLDGNEYNGEEIASNGNHIIKISAIDAAGNSTNKQVSFIIDKNPPIISVKGIENGGTYYNVVKAKISVNEGSYLASLDGKEYTGADITRIGNHKLIVTAKDAVNNISAKTINFVIATAVTSDAKSSDLVGKAIITSPDKTVSVNLVNTTIINQELFKVILGIDKSVSFTVNSNNTLITWTFNCKEINPNNIKNIDLALNVKAPNESVISKIDSNAQILSFKDNGVLPAPATLKIKIDSTKIDTKKGIYFYYYNLATRNTELIAGPLTPDADGYVTVTIKHCSDYFLSNNDNTKVQKSVASLPKTGSVIDMRTLIIIGIGCVVIGAVLAFGIRKGKKA